MDRWLKIRVAAACLALAATSGTALAQDTLKIAAGQRGNWDTSVSEVGQRAGIFKKHGLVLEILWTQGSGETQQAVLSGSVDVGVAVGVMGALSSFSKGAPVRVIGAETTGAEILASLDGHIARWQSPDQVLFVDDIPLGATGKIDKKLIRERMKGYVLPTAQPVRA